MIKNPNIHLWQNYKNYSNARGELIWRMISPLINNQKSRILDVGCGSCGIAKYLSAQNIDITAIDITITNEARQNQKKGEFGLVQNDIQTLFYKAF